MDLNEIYNPDELIPPTWMNEEFFETVLRSAKDDDFEKIIGLTVGPATVRGDHYASIMFRGIIKYFDKAGFIKDISLIIKTMPEINGPKKEFLKQSKIFEVEIEMLRDIIPTFEEMLRKVGDNTRLSANMLFYTLSPRKVIVLEDITKIGFSTVSKRMCNIEETKMALDMLAKWHACSYMLNEETRGVLEKFQDGIFNVPGTESNILFTNGTERVVTVAKKTPELQQYVEKLERIQDLIFQKCTKVYDLCKKKGRINVLTHGDFHAKNLMFKFNPETGLAEKVILVDFQLSVWGSMALDLLYFIYMTIEGEVREKYLEELIYNFFQKFRATLQRLGFKRKIPKFFDLKMDMLNICHVEVFLATTLLPLIVALIENPDMDPQFIMTNEEALLSIYDSKAFIRELEPVLKRFLHSGFLDSVVEEDEDE